jgi:hypothetical protein
VTDLTCGQPDLWISSLGNLDTRKLNRRTIVNSHLSLTPMGCGSVPKNEMAHFDEHCQPFWQRTGYHFLRPNPCQVANNPAGQKTLIDLILDLRDLLLSKAGTGQKESHLIFGDYFKRVHSSNLLLLAVTLLLWSHSRSGRTTDSRSNDIERGLSSLLCGRFLWIQSQESTRIDQNRHDRRRRAVFQPTTWK